MDFSYILAVMIEEISRVIAENIVSFGELIGQWLDEHLVNVLVIVLVAWIIKRVGSRLVHQLLKGTVRPDLYPTKTDRDKRLKTLDGLISAVVKFAVFVVAAFMIIGEINPGYTAALFAGAGLITVAIGFGAQSLVKDFVSGIFIIVENQYRVGDVVTIAGASGTVEEVTIRTTVLRDLDGNAHHVPNGLIEVTTNKTIGFSRINEEIVVGFDADVDRVEHIINHVGEEISALTEFEKKIKEPIHFASVKGYAINGLRIGILGKTNPGDQWKIRTEMYKRLKREFDKAKIEVTSMAAMPAANGSKKKSR